MNPFMAKYTLSPLLKDGRHCLVWRDVEGIEGVAFELVEFYHGGSPWQRIPRESDDLFALVEREHFHWPPLERIAGARFRIRLTGERRARCVNVRPCVGTANGETLIEKWLIKRGFVEIPTDECESVA